VHPLRLTVTTACVASSVHNSWLRVCLRLVTAVDTAHLVALVSPLLSTAMGVIAVLISELLLVTDSVGSSW
jgi:hypothetical protein